MIYNTSVVFHGRRGALDALQVEFEKAMTRDPSHHLSLLLQYVGYVEEELEDEFFINRTCGNVIQWYMRDGFLEGLDEFVVITETEGHPCLYVFKEFLERLRLPELEIVYYSEPFGEKRMITNSKLFKEDWMYEGVVGHPNGSMGEEGLATMLSSLLWKEAGLPIERLIDLYQEKHPDAYFKKYEFQELDKMY